MLLAKHTAVTCLLD